MNIPQVDMNGIPAPAPGTQIIQEMAHISPTSIASMQTTSFTTTWPKAVRLVEFQHRPGLVVDHVLIGQTKFEKRDYEGRRVEKDIEVTVHLTNIGNVPVTAEGVWYVEEASQKKDEAHDPIPAVPAVPVAVNHGAPQGPAPSITTTVSADGNQTFQHIPPNGPVPAPMGQPVPVPSAAPSHLGYQQVGGGGQQFIHSGGAPQPAVHAGNPGEFALLMSRERASKIAFVIKGGVLMPQEIPALAYAIEQGMQQRATSIRPGANEVVVYVTEEEAKRVLAIVRGTDTLAFQAIMHKFNTAANGG